MIPNIILNHKNLSLKSKGLCAYLLSKPDDWIFKKQVILSELKEGLDAFNSAIKELTEAGFLCKTLIRDKNGYFIGTEYIIYDEPQIDEPYTDEPSMENPSMVSPSMEKPPHYNNTNNNKTDNIKIKDNKEKNIKKENSFEDSFIEFYKIYEQPKKEIDLQSQRIQKIYKKWKSCKDPEQIIEGAKDYIKYLELTKQSWSNGGCDKKDIIAWLNSNYYEKNWEQKCKEEEQKIQNKQKPTMYQKQETDDEKRLRNTREGLAELKREQEQRSRPKQIKVVNDDDEMHQIDYNNIPF